MENTEKNKKVEMIDSNKKTFVPLYAKYMFDNSKFIDLKSPKISFSNAMKYSMNFKNSYVPLR